MHHEHVVPAHIDQRADLVLAILKRALFMLAEHEIEMLRDAQAVIPRGLNCKQAELAIHQHTVLHRFSDAILTSEPGSRFDLEQSKSRRDRRLADNAIDWGYSTGLTEP